MKAISGIIFSILVITLLFLGLLSTSKVEKIERPYFPLAACELTPDWIYTTYDAWAFLSKHGLSTYVNNVYCSDTISFGEETFPYKKGYTTIISQPSTLYDDKAHCLYGDNGNLIIIPYHKPKDADLILTHEILHCLNGYQDVKGLFNLLPPPGHIMNPQSSRAGWSTTGMSF